MWDDASVRLTHTYRWLGNVPLLDGADAMTVSWLTIEIRKAAGEVTYSNSFITDLPANRARRKIRDEASTS